MNDSTKYQVFSVQQVDSFKRLEDLDILLPVPIEFVIDVLCSDPKFAWSKGEKADKSNTSVQFVVNGAGAGRPVTYVRTVRAQLGPLKFCSVFYTSQFLDNQTVQMHCCETGGGHLVSRFRCVADPSGQTRIVYEELMSAGALVLKLGAKAIRKARLGHLEHLKIRLESRFANRNSMSSDQISMNSQSEVVEPTLSDLEDEVCVPDTGKILSDGEEE